MRPPKRTSNDRSAATLDWGEAQDPPDEVAMNCAPTPATLPPRPRVSVAWIVAGMMLCLLLFSAYSVVSFFQLGSETRVLRNSLTHATGGEWHTRIALNAGWITTSLLRAGTRLINLPAEAKTVLGALHGIEVGIYRQQSAPLPSDYGGILQVADNEMATKGWERVVGVVQARELVAVYCPRKGLTPRHMKCCVMVVTGEDLVIAGVRGNLQALVPLAAGRLHFGPAQTVAFR